MKDEAELEDNAAEEQQELSPGQAAKKARLREAAKKAADNRTQMQKFKAVKKPVEVVQQSDPYNPQFKNKDNSSLKAALRKAMSTRDSSRIRKKLTP